MGLPKKKWCQLSQTQFSGGRIMGQFQSSNPTELAHGIKIAGIISSVTMGLLLRPSGKRLHNYGKSPFLMGKSTISMAIFNSYGKLPHHFPHHFCSSRRTLCWTSAAAPRWACCGNTCAWPTGRRKGAGAVVPWPQSGHGFWVPTDVGFTAVFRFEMWL